MTVMDTERSRIFSPGVFRMSPSMSVKSAALPTSMEPFSFSRKTLWAALMV